MSRAFFNDILRIRALRKPKYNIPIKFTNYSNFHTSAGLSLSNPLPRLVRYGLASTLVGGLGYYGYINDLFPWLSKIPLEEINEDSFDSKDDLVVLILNSKRVKNYPSEQVELLRSVLPKGVSLYYSVKNPSNQDGFRVMFCKGMRKKYYPLLDLSDKETLKGLKEDLKDFFEPLSQDLSDLNNDNVPEYVSYNNFKSRVVEAANKDHPILVQMFEDSCFLCFLIRPFINSVNKHLEETKNPIRIKRLNIELNDFPNGCPVTRATPTFVYYDGRDKGLKWDEFKPQEFIQKLSKVGNLNDESRKYLDDLGEKISERFMLFGKLALWLSETQKMQELVFKSYSDDFELTSDEDMYSRSINVLMDIDMKRTDCLEENLENLKSEIDSAEKDCLAIAEILGQEVLKSERETDSR